MSCIRATHDLRARKTKLLSPNGEVRVLHARRGGRWMLPDPLDQEHEKADEADTTAPHILYCLSDASTERLT